MATVPKTFSWTSNLDSFSWTETGSAEGTAGWSSTGGDTGSGDDAGCLKVQTNSGRNNDIGGYFSRTLNFEAMGVPSGATVTGITSASIRTYVQTFNIGSGGNTVLGAVTLSDGTTTVTLAAQRTVTTSADGSYQTQTGTNNTSLSWASTQNVTITINVTANGQNAASAQIIDYLDKLTFTITYIQNYQLTCNHGTFNYTGYSSTESVAKSLSCSYGSLTVDDSYEATMTEEAALDHYELECNYGTFTVTGDSARIGEVPLLIPGVGLVLDPGLYPGGLVGSYEEVEAAQDYPLTCNHGTYSYTGYSINDNWDRPLTAEYGTYSITGYNTDLYKTSILYCNYDTFSVSGYSAGVNVDHILSCEYDTYDITGYSADILYSPLLEAQYETYATSGYSSDLLVGYVLSCGYGSYNFTGYDATVNKGKSLGCEYDTYAISGIDQDFDVVKTISNAYGNYDVTGYDATLDYQSIIDSPLTCYHGTFTYAGYSADLLTGYALSVNYGSYTGSGIGNTLLASHVLSCSVGTYTLSGYSSGVDIGYLLSNEYGEYTYTGYDIDEDLAKTLSVSYGEYDLTGYNATLAYSGYTSYSYLIPDVGLVETDGTVLLPGGLLDPVPQIGAINYPLVCYHGIYSVSGIDSTLTATQLDHYELECNHGSYSVNGYDTTLTAGLHDHYTLECETSSYNVKTYIIELKRGGTITKLASGYTLSAYTNPGNIYVSDDTYATATPAQNSNISGVYTFPTFTSIPNGADITHIRGGLEYHVSNNSSYVYYQYYRIGNGDTYITPQVTGSLSNGNLSLSDIWIYTDDFEGGLLNVPTVTNLKTSGYLQAQFYSRRGNDSTSTTFYLDAVNVSVSYTEPKALICNAGEFDVTSSNGDFLEGQHPYLTCNSGSVAVSGQQISIDWNYRQESLLLPGVGLLTYGEDVLLPGGLIYWTTEGADKILQCSRGNYTLLGRNITTDHQTDYKQLICYNGLVNVTGYDSTIRDFKAAIYWVEFEVPLFVLQDDNNEINTYTLTGYDLTSKITTPVLGTLKGDAYLYGQNATLAYGYELVSQYGEFDVTGYDTTLTETQVNKQLICNSGSYSVSGVSNTLKIEHLLESEYGEYLVSGYTATALRNKKISVLRGLYSLTGKSITETLANKISLNRGTYSIKRYTATLLKNKFFTAQYGTVQTSGTVAGLSIERAGAYELNCAWGGVFVIEGSLLLTKEKSLVCLNGSFQTRGMTQEFVKNYPLVADNFEDFVRVTGYDVTWKYSPITSMEYTSYTVSGQDAILKKGGWNPKSEPDSSWAEEVEPTSGWTEKTEPDNLWYNIS